MLNRKYLVLLGFCFLATKAAGVPLEIEPGPYESATIHLNVLINGQSQRLMFDTGSNLSSIPSNDQTKMLSKTTGASAYGAYGQSACDLIVVPSFTIDQITLRDLQLGRCGDGNTGTLGIDVLNYRVWKFDFTNKQLVEAPGAIATQPLKRANHNVVELPLTINGETHMALFDTGAALSSVDMQYVNQHLKLFEPVATVLNQDAVGKRERVFIFKVAKLKVGDVEFENVMFTGTSLKMLQTTFDPNLQFIIGANVIGRKNWILDLKTNRFSIEPK